MSQLLDRRTFRSSHLPYADRCHGSPPPAGQKGLPLYPATCRMHHLAAFVVLAAIVVLLHEGRQRGPVTVRPWRSLPCSQVEVAGQVQPLAAAANEGAPVTD